MKKPTYKELVEMLKKMTDGYRGMDNSRMYEDQWKEAYVMVNRAIPIEEVPVTYTSLKFAADLIEAYIDDDTLLKCYRIYPPEGRMFNDDLQPMDIIVEYSVYLNEHRMNSKQFREAIEILNKKLEYLPAELCH